MTDEDRDQEDLLGRARDGDGGALPEMFERYRGRLEQMVRLRLDRGLQGRLDPADVLQEAYLDVARWFPEYVADSATPFFLWLRFLTGQRLIDLHRQHLGTKMRDAGLEVSVYRGDFPRVSSASLAELLLGRLTSASRAGRFQEAVPLLEQSLWAGAKNGRAVLNWLWLALAHQRLDNAEEARRWFDKAKNWLVRYRSGCPTAPMRNWVYTCTTGWWLTSCCARTMPSWARAPPRRSNRSVFVSCRGFR
jgi:RNA polymerase sigma-70 factor (ECF subfamily)